MSLALPLVLGLLLDVLHLTLDVVFLPVVAHHTLQCIGVLDPLDQASVAAERHDSIGSQLEVSLAGLRVIH